jgi:hypothetical protein
MDALGKAAAAAPAVMLPAVVLLVAVLLTAGCTSDKPKPYGSEARLSISTERPMV